MAAVNVWDYERLAEQKLDANAHAYFAGGAGDEVTLRDNLAAFERRKLRPRVLVDVSSVSTATTVLGQPIDFPVLAAPMSVLGLAHPDGDMGLVRATAAAVAELDGVQHPMGANDTTWVPAGVPHRFINASDTKAMRIFWIYASVDATRTVVATGETRSIDSERV